MKVLILDSAPPATAFSGKSVRFLNIFKRLGLRHELHYLAIVGRSDSLVVPAWLQEVVASTQVWRRKELESQFGRYANWVRAQPWFYAPWRYPADYRTLSASLRQQVEDQGIDMVHCFDEEVAQFIPDDLPCPWILDQGDAMALHAARRSQQAKGLLQKLRWRSMAWRLARYERQMVNRAQAAVFVSPVDAACYGTNGSRAQVQVIPNGVDSSYFAPLASNPLQIQAPTLLFTGHLSFEPNREAARWLIDELLPRIRREVSHVVCAIVGADPTPDLLERQDARWVIVTGRVKDLRPYFEEASVYVCPMHLGAGIKNKLLEAMAMEKAIVTTPRAAEGLPVRDGEHLLLAEGAEGMAARVIELLYDPARREALGRQARRLVVERYSWELSSQAYEQLYQRLYARRTRIAAEVAV